MNTTKIYFNNKTFKIIAVALFTFVFLAFAQTASASVTGVTVTAPISGGAWSVTQNITWDCDDDGISPTCSDVSLDSISYSPDGGTTWEPVGYTSGPFASVETFFWNTLTGNTGSVPNTESTNGVIRVILNSAGVNNTSDIFTVDNTRPKIASAITADTNSNGYLDRVTVTIDDGAVGSGVNACTTAGWIVVGATITSCNVNTLNQVELTFTDGILTTDSTPNVIYNETIGNTNDQAGNELTDNTATAEMATDGAAPIPMSAEIIDHDNDGLLDLVSIKFSEVVDARIYSIDNENTNFSVSGPNFGTITEGSVVTDGNKQGNSDSSDLTLVSYNFTPTNQKTDVDDLVIVFTTNTSSKIEDGAGNVVPSFTLNVSGNTGLGNAAKIDDGAAPVAMKSEYFVHSSTPASVDRFRVYFSEDLATTAYGDFLGITFGNVTLAPGALTNFLGPAAIGDNTNGTDNVFFTTTFGTSDLTGANGGAEPTWSYLYDGSNTLQDEAGNLWEYIIEDVAGTQTIADAASPVVIDELTLDTNGDGNVDTLELQFSEYVEDGDFTANSNAAVADWLLSSDSFTSNDAFDTFSTEVTDIAVANIADDDYIALSLTPSNVSGTFAMRYQYNNDASDNITDSDANVLVNINSAVAADGAAPQIIELIYKDDNGDGQIDLATLNFSEYLTASSFLSADDLLFTNVGDFTDMLFGTDAANLITGAVSSVDVVLGTDATPLDTRDDSLLIAFSSQNAFSLVDAGSNTNSVLGAQAQATITDEAAPVLLTADTLTRTTGDGDGNTLGMYLVYTEDVSMSSDTVSDYIVSVVAGGAVITVSDVVQSPGTVDERLTLLLDTTDPDQTTAPLELSYTLGVVEDWVNNQAEASNMAIDDEANPVLIGFVADKNPAGIDDNLDFTLTFSEPMNTGVPLTGTTFDVAGSGVPGPYGVDNISYLSNTWTADYDTNPILSGTPESGTHTFGTPVASGVDLAGNAMAILGSLVMTFDIDSVVPDTTGIVVDPATQEVGLDITITASASDDTGVQSAELFIDGISMGLMTADDGSFGGTTELLTMTVAVPVGTGVKEVWILASDAVNTEVKDGDNTETFTATAPSGGGDTTPPAISSISTDKAEYRVTQDPSVVVKIIEDDTASTVTVNGYAATETATPGTWEYTFAHGGAEGTFSLVVVATDAASNPSTQSISYNVVVDDAPDTTAPSVVSTTPVTGAVSVSTSAGVVSVKYDENVTIDSQSNITIEKVGGASVKNGNATIAGDTLSINYNTLEYGTSYKVTVLTAAVEDIASNNTVADTVIYFTTQSATAPVISALGVSNVMADSATIDWVTDVVVDTAEYRYSSNLYGGVWTSMTAGGSGAQALAGLSPNTTYYYQVRFVKNGETTESVPAMFTTTSSNTGISVDSTQSISSYATANNTYANGWKWKFAITLNDLTETNLAMKFDQWTSGANIIDAADNMRYSIDDVTWTTITANGAYPATNIDVSAIDNNVTAGGRQVDVYVEMKVPTGSAGGSYSAQYGVKSEI